MIYANDFDADAAHWLSCLPFGFDEVDNRSIKEVRARDVIGYKQCHFFAGIGGWPLALAMGGWPIDREVWTGSCPCQPFSAAGKRKGTQDERHLWPEFRRLIDECRPATIFGEQVASKDGRDWLSVVRTDLEAMGYAVGAADLCAAGVGAPHIRQRLFWVANCNMHGRDQRRPGFSTKEHDGAVGNSAYCGVADTNCIAIRSNSGATHGTQVTILRREESFNHGPGTSSSTQCIGMANCSCLDGKRNWAHAGCQRCDSGSGPYRGMDSGERCQCCIDNQSNCGLGDTDRKRQSSQRTIPRGTGALAAGSFWANAEYVPCRDGKARPVKPGVRLLAHGIPGRVAQLRGLGNAIVPQVAAEFVAAFLETTAHPPSATEPITSAEEK